jgi:uncharacterized protein (UPF0335 family)
MIEYLNISNYIQPYLPRFLITDYYKQYFEICLIDIIYFYFNHPHLYDAKSMIYKNVKDIVSQHMKYDFTCNIYHDIYEMQELNEMKLHESNYMIECYTDELKRIENIYEVFQKYYSYDGTKKYKNAHLSYELGRRDTRSCCNIKEFIKNKLCKKYIEDKLQYQFNMKKIKEKDKTVIFILDIIDKLFNNYIDSLKYGIDVLQNRPYIVNYSEEYLPKVYQDNFIEKDNIIYVKHLGFINNISITNSLNDDILNKGYVKIFRPKKSNRIVIWFE